MDYLKQDVAYESDTAKLRTPCGFLYCTIVYAEDSKPLMVILHLGKAGGCAKAHLSMLSEHINLAIERDDITAVSALAKITGFTCSEGSSCSDVAAHYILDKILKRRDAINDED